MSDPTRRRFSFGRAVVLAIALFPFGLAALIAVQVVAERDWLRRDDRWRVTYRTVEGELDDAEAYLRPSETGRVFVFLPRAPGERWWGLDRDRAVVFRAAPPDRFLWTWSYPVDRGVGVDVTSDLKFSPWERTLTPTGASFRDPAGSLECEIERR